MSKGYPGRTRATKAFWRGAVSAGREFGRNPYANATLAKLWERGRKRMGEQPPLAIPPQFRPKPPRTSKGPPKNRPSDPGRRGFHRGQDRPRGRSPW
jgi:hypothetical protein